MMPDFDIPPTVAYAVVGHAARGADATRLAARVGGKLFMDTDGLGEWRNHARAWRWLESTGARWCVVLQDDALPIKGFRPALEQHLASSGRTCVSLYAGISKPRKVQGPFRQAIRAAGDAGWLQAASLYWGVGVALPGHDIHDMLTGSDSRLPYDERIGDWYRRQNRPVLYTWPSMVDHADGPTLLRHADGQLRNLPRVAHKTGVPGDPSKIIQVKGA